MLGRKRAFAIGCVIYGAGSLTTSISQSLTVLIIGWSVLEGIGASLIMPAIVALVASNFEQSERPRAYGLIAASGAIAVAAGPLIGGLFTTYLSWRLVFASEVVIVIAILFLTRRMADTPPDPAARLDLVGTALSGAGLSLIVFGILQAGAWGVIQPKEGAPVWLGVSPVIWLFTVGAAVLGAFMMWEQHRIDHDQGTLLDPAMLKIPQLRGGLIAFFFQFLLQMGLFFVVPLFLSVALGLSAVETGVRVLPLSVSLLITAVGIPKVFPHANPRRVVRAGFLMLLAGIVTLIVLLDVGAGPEIVTWPMLLAGFGIGSLASQLGAVTVGAVPDEQTDDVGGLQNTVTNLGASVGTALAGAVLIAALTSSFLAGITNAPAVPDSVSNQAQVQLSSGAPFISDAQLEDALAEANVPPDTAKAITDENAAARIDGLRAALAVLALLAVFALIATWRLPTKPAESNGTPASSSA